MALLSERRGWLENRRESIVTTELVQLSFGALRLRYREGFDREVLLRPGEAVAVRIRLCYVGHQLPPGGVLQLLVGGGLFEPIATAIAMRASRQSVLHGVTHASRIELPVLS